MNILPLFKKLKDPVFKPLAVQWLKAWSFIFKKYDSLPLHLVETYTENEKL
jgi:hypothetical protein